MVRQRHAASAPLSPIAETEKGEKKRKERRGNMPNVTRKTVLFAASALAAILLLVRYGPTIHHHHNNEMPGYVPQWLPKMFTPVPPSHAKTFWTDGGKISFPMVRALRDHGWQKANDWRDAHIIYQYSAESKFFHKLMKWQRFGHVPRHSEWNQKDAILDGYKRYQQETGAELYSLPESYRLSVKSDLRQFQQVLRDGGDSHPWVLKKPAVNQGRGIEMIGPYSPRLNEVIKEMSGKDYDYDYIIQKYICKELTWKQRKFDVRMFWFVASVDPVVVLYHDGYTRIGNSEYHEDDFDNTVAHLTTHTGLGEEGKATFDEFCEHISKHHRASPHLRHIKDPVMHVKNQFKDTLAEFVEAFKDISFSHPGTEELVPENGFGFYGADFILDEDLDVWFIEPQKGCGLDEDYKMRVEMHDKLFGGMVDTLEEVWQKQEAGEQLLPLNNTGGWEIIYGDGWRFKYEGYKRSKNKAGCGNTKKSSTTSLRSTGRRNL
jgi:hypothetical protein